MKFQVGDLVMYFHIAEARRNLCLVIKVDELPDGSVGFVNVEWLTEFAKKNYTKSLPPSSFYLDASGYWSKLS